VAEVLNPAGEAVALKAVVAPTSWAAVESWEHPRVLAFLLQLALALRARETSNERDGP
jgi:hypothetical protein